MKSKFMFTIDDKSYTMDIDKVKSKISSEYYSNFFGEKKVRITEGKCKEEIVLTPDTYEDLIRVIHIDFNVLTSQFKSGFESLSTKLIQFPILVISGGDAVEIKKLIKYLTNYAIDNEMYFLVYFKSKVMHFLRNKNELKDVHYSTRNRIFIKQMIHPTERVNKRSDFYIDISEEIPNLDKLNKLQNSFYDDYSDSTIVHGPNLWVYCSKQVEPKIIKERVVQLSKCKLNKVFLDSFLHRFVNCLPSGNVTSLKGHLYLDHNGIKTVRKFDKEYKELKKKTFCNRECGSFSFFCPQDEEFCKYYKDIFKEIK